MTNQKPFTKIINPYSVKIDNRTAQVYVKIEYKIKDDKGRLSLSGVEGPTPNGNCLGSCGQINVYLPNVKNLNAGWTREMVAINLADIWEDWHLNDMRPYSEAMKKANWDIIGRTTILKHEFILKSEYFEQKNAIRKRTEKKFIEGKTITPTQEESRILSLPYGHTIYAYPNETPIPPNEYRFQKKETKTLGWVTPSEHPDGLLTKKLHPDDEHGYGQKWFYHPVPHDILDWLRALPETENKPAWV